MSRREQVELAGDSDDRVAFCLWEENQLLPEHRRKSIQDRGELAEKLRREGV